MLVTGIKSKPVYAPLQADIRGRYHLMLGMGAGGDALLRVLGELQGAAPQAISNTRLLFVPDAVPNSRAAPGPAGIGLDAGVGLGAGIGLDAGVGLGAGIGLGVAVGLGAGVGVAGGAIAATVATGATGIVERFRSGGVADLRLFADSSALLQEFRTVLTRSLMGTRLYVAGPESFMGLVMKIALEFNLNKDEIRAEESGTLARRIYCIHCRATTEQVRTNIVRCVGCDRWLLVRDHYSRRLAAYMGVMADAEAPGELPPLKEVFL